MIIFEIFDLVILRWWDTQWWRQWSFIIFFCTDRLQPLLLQLIVMRLPPLYHQVKRQWSHIILLCGHWSFSWRPHSLPPLLLSKEAGASCPLLSWEWGVATGNSLGSCAPSPLPPLPLLEIKAVVTLHYPSLSVQSVATAISLSSRTPTPPLSSSKASVTLCCHPCKG